MSRAEEGISDKAFAVWLTRNPQGLTGLVIAIFYVLIVVLKNVREIGSVNVFPDYYKHEDLYDSIPSLVQCLALVPPLWWCFRVVPPRWSKDKVANRASIQFARCLAALIAAWIVFYLLNFLTLNHWIRGREPWIDLCNNMQGVFLFACYWTLTAITVPESEEQNTSGTLRLSLIFSFSLWTILVFHLADLTVHTNNSRFWFQLLSSLAVGVCMALMVGCLESEYLESPRALTACLYCYSVLQLAYIGFNPPAEAPCSALTGACRDELLTALSEHRILQLFSTVTSLPLKFLFIGLCYWHIRSGRLPFYMEKTRTLLKTVGPQWDDFRQGRVSGSAGSIPR
jgi:hypothetical protein